MAKAPSKLTGNVGLTGLAACEACTGKEGRLAKALALHGSLSAAYHEAGYARNPHNSDTDHNNARAIFSRARVFACYEYWREEFSRRIDISDDRILAEMAATAFIDPRQMVDMNGQLIDLADMPEVVSRAIKKIKVRRRVIDHRTQAPDEDITETETVAEDIIEIEFHDKLKALQWIADVNGMKPQEAPPEITVNVNIDGKAIEKEPDS